MRRAPALLWAALAPLALGACAGDEPTGRTRAARPNFVVVLADDLGYGDLGAFGHPFAQTPNFDQLAREGLRLTSFYAASPACSPSRAGLHTGRHPYRMGIFDIVARGSEDHLPGDELTIASLLQRAGYATGIVGKWHLTGRPLAGQPGPGELGFDHAFVFHGNAYLRNGRRTRKLQSASQVAREALRWLKSIRAGEPGAQPFFLFVGFREPHFPHRPMPRSLARYAELAEPERAAFYATVTEADAALGLLLRGLARRGLDENTLVVASSDNGALERYGSNHGLRGGKRTTFEGGIRVPGVVRWPAGIEAGRVSDAVVSQLDLLPTFAELAGAARPGDRALDGTSLVPLLEGRALRRERPLLWHDRWQKFAIRRGDWKLRAFADGSGAELYHLPTDRAETRDRAPAEPDRVAGLVAELTALIAELREDCACDWPGGGPAART